MEVKIKNFEENLKKIILGVIELPPFSLYR